MIGSTHCTRLWATVALCVLCLSASAAAQSTLAADYLTDDNLVILEVRLGSEVISPGLIAYQIPDGVMLPLGAMTDMLEFALDVSPERGHVDGWFVNEQRRFSLDLASGQVLSGGQSYSCTSSQAAADEDDIYVDASLFGAWFPLDVDVRLGQLLAVITARETLPIQSRLKRESIRTSRLARERYEDDSRLFKADYQLFTWPLIDANLEYRGRGPHMAPHFSLQSSGDVGTLATHTFVTHTNGPVLVNAARLRAGRTDADGELLGRLHATQFEFGDLYAPSTPLVLRGKLGRGALLSNRPLRRPDRFDTTEIQGDGPPGWEVELYGNNALLDFTTVDETGRYLFEDVPLNFGRNIFRSVLFGPQGQTREHTRTVNVGSDMIAPGQFEYRLFAVQDDRFLITGDDLLDGSQDRGHWTGHFETGYGLGKSLSLLGGWTRQPLAGVDSDYLSFTASAAVKGFHLRAVGVNALQAGQAAILSVQGEVLGRSLTAEQSIFQDFLSDANEIGRQRTDESRLRIGGSTLMNGRNLAYDLKLQTTGFTNRGITRQDQVQLRAATVMSGLQMSTRLDYRNSTSVAGGYSQLFADQLARGIWGPLLLRGSMRARVNPDATIESVTGSASWQPLPNLRVGTHVVHRFDGIATTTVGGSLGLLMDSFQLNLSASSSGEQEPYISIAVSTSFTKVPEVLGMHVQRHRMSGGYGATARVFLDRNANGFYDDQDDPLPEVRITGAGSHNEATTGPHGMAYIAGLPAHRERDLSLDVTSLQDPFLLPAVDGLRATGHPGAHLVIDFPVTFSGDIEGTVYARTPTGDVPLRNIGLELVDLSQRSVRKTVSEFDGYYLFQEVPPGWYEVHIIPETLERKNLRMPAPVAAAVPPEGGVSAGNDFILRFVEERRASR